MNSRTLCLIAAGAALMVSIAGDALAQLENLPGGMEHLRGRHWSGKECCNWSWEWVQTSGPTFRGVFTNTNQQKLVEDDIIITIHGDTVTITRKGGSAAGGCTYIGKIRPGSADGTYACNGQQAGPWGATIFQTP